MSVTRAPPPAFFGAVVRPIQAFLRLEAASGILLLACAIAALIWANAHPVSYASAVEAHITAEIGGAKASFTVRELINDCLMAVFFFVVGMEIKRELVAGELNTRAKAALPAIAALGGMLLPAGIYAVSTIGTEGARGWGIPMATDIAFCVGVLTLLRDRVPRALIVFVTALAIFDDIGGILVIAVFYGHHIEVTWLGAALGLTFVAFGMNRAFIVNGLLYAIVGAALWYALKSGGVHATISGVILGMMVPARPQRPSRDVLMALASHVTTLHRRPPDEQVEAAEVHAIEEELEDLQAPVHRFIHSLHPIVAFGIMPVFALVNSGVYVRDMGVESLASPIALGVAGGLVVGKSIGIFSFTAAAVKLGVSPMPGGATWPKLAGVSVIAGIGFTVALFIAGLAFHDDHALLDEAKIGIVIGSAIAGAVGFALLRFTRNIEVVRGSETPAERG